MMRDILGWIALGTSVIVVLWLLGADHSRSMETCQKVASFDTCAMELR